MAHGFFDNTVNGQRILSHGGNILTFISLLFLIPEQNVGVFISTSSAGGRAANETIVKAFLDRYYPVSDPPDPQSAAGFAERIAPFLGEYTSARSNFTSYEKTNSLAMRANASLGSDGILTLAGLRFAEVEPGLLQQIGDPASRLVYRTSPDGRLFMTGIAGATNEPQTVFKTPWYGTASLHLLLFLSSTLLFLGAMIAWPIGFIAGRRKKLPATQPTPLPARLARWAAALFGLLWLVALLGFASIFTDIVPGFGVPRIWFGTPPVLNLVLVLAYMLGGLALAILVFAALAWVRRYWSLGGRIFYSLLALLALLLTWSLVYWNLLL